MTESEAIKILQKKKECDGSLDCLLGLRDECNDCALVIENKTLFEALDMAIEALEKQEPMRPGDPELGISPRHPIITPCGNCGEELKDLFWDYCPWCGQRIERCEKNDCA